ncbi:DUF2470 domain-containing protein [Nocardiopsis gilva YIM 90087]|uniref:DUF2470 domain-containing protein n=1 Tax=Nocardiopsis gilva YIM 90087 TaxID=1235441 RepID=A0A223S5A5_9ACTN|nr:DUF2470 domain-containing protein [Nocardiopsis gilva]ASU83305.1 DUF2470 domain-containing protein [Nocardiopsis gilva YIM 90087]
MRQPSPSAIERVRSLAATATPTTAVLANNPDTRFSVRGAVDHAGRAVLWAENGHPLHEALRASQHDRADLTIGVGLSALRHVGRTPTVRARLWCDGHVSIVPAGERRDAALAVWDGCPDEELLAAVDHDPMPDAPLLARVEPATVMYHTYDAAGLIDGASYMAMRPDPITGAAERILRHVNDCHRDELSASLRHLPEAPDGAAWLWELDAQGVTLWVNPVHGGHPALIRVPWSSRVTRPCQLERALFDLMSRHGSAAHP